VPCENVIGTTWEVCFVAGYVEDFAFDCYVAFFAINSIAFGQSFKGDRFRLWGIKVNGRFGLKSTCHDESIPDSLVITRKEGKKT